MDTDTAGTRFICCTSIFDKKDPMKLIIYSSAYEALIFRLSFERIFNQKWRGIVANASGILSGTDTVINLIEKMIDI